MISEEKISKFISEAGFRDYQAKNLNHDASSRRYKRLFNDDSSVIFMYSPKEGDININNPTKLSKNYLQRFVTLTNFLRANKILSPEILAVNYDDDLAIISDLGELSFRKYFSQNPGFNDIYKKFLDLLLYILSLDITNFPKNNPIYGLPLYDKEIYLNEINIMYDWFIEKSSFKICNNLIADTNNVWRKYFDKLPNPNSIILRDMHADNIFINNTHKDFLFNIGLIDFQDALLGHDVYDLVSFTQDARTEYNRQIEELAISYFITNYKKQKPDFCEKDFLFRYHLVGAQRAAKILGVFSRLTLREKYTNYKQYIQNTFNIFSYNLNYVELKDLKDQYLKFEDMWDFYG